jgi:hypothetical protein
MPIFILDAGGQVHFTVLYVSNPIIELRMQYWLMGWSCQFQIDILGVSGKVLASPGELSYMCDPC